MGPNLALLSFRSTFLLICSAPAKWVFQATSTSGAFFSNWKVALQCCTGFWFCFFFFFFFYCSDSSSWHWLCRSRGGGVFILVQREREVFSWELFWENTFLTNTFWKLLCGQIQITKDDCHCWEMRLAVWFSACSPWASPLRDALEMLRLVLGNCQTLFSYVYDSKSEWSPGPSGASQGHL